MEYNSRRNQEIKGQFVKREIVYCLSSVMDEVFSAGLVNYEDIENYWVYPEYRGTYADFDGGTEEQRQEEIDRLNELLESIEEELHDEDTPPTNTEEIEAKADKLTAEIEELESLDQEAQDIYEWWLVTDWMYEKLQEIGEPVLEWGSLNIWGRGCSGQAILLDYSISKICEGMEILEGQPNEWK